MSRIDTSLSEAFGIPNIERPTLPKVIDVEVIDVPLPDNELDADIKFVREKLQSLITKGEDAVEILTSIARAEESPRSFEVLNTMLSTLSDLSMQFISLHEKKAKIAKAKAEKGMSPAPVLNNNTTNNIAFVGSSSDLDTLLEERRKKRELLKDVT